MRDFAAGREMLSRGKLAYFCTGEVRVTLVCHVKQVRGQVETCTLCLYEFFEDVSENWSDEIEVVLVFILMHEKFES